MTLNWDIPKTFDAFEELYNKINQNDSEALSLAIEDNINENIGVDFVEDILGNMAGRLVYMTYMVPPARINSQSTLVGLQLVDPDAAQETMETMFEQENWPELKEKKVRGVTIYQLPGPGARRRQRQNQEEDEFDGRDPFESGNLRRPEPGFAFIDDYLVISDSMETIEHAIQTSDGRFDGLETEEEFGGILEEVERQIGSARAGMLLYSRPHEVLRNFYDLGSDKENRQRLRDAGENQPFLGRLSDRIDGAEIPSFEALEKYMSSAGGVMTADESGFHYFTFGFRPDPEK
jgi:hypothetical protein